MICSLGKIRDGNARQTSSPVVAGDIPYVVGGFGSSLKFLVMLSAKL
jgi:hypothetical protein